MENYILINATVTDGLTFLRENCDIEIKDSKILKIGKGLDKGRNIKTIDLGGRLVLPGLVNPHHHLYSALAVGIAPLGPVNNFTQKLEQLWWPLDRSLDKNSIYYSAMNGLMQSVRYGVTTVVDHHASMNAVSGSLNIIKKAYEELGVKGLLCYEVSDRMGEDAVQTQIDENIDFWKANKNNSQVKGLMGLHANFTLSESSMKKIAEQKPKDLPIHIHCAEDGADKRYCQDLGYAGAVDRLNEFGLLSKDSLLVHCIHLSDKDHEILHKVKPNIISNPESNANNNVGMMDIERIKKYVVGTDGMTGNTLGTMRSHFLQGHGNLADPMNLLFKNIADMLSRYFPDITTLKEGGLADLAITNYRPVTGINLDNLFYHLMFGVQGKEMFMTIANGDIIFADNDIQTVDEKQINENITKAAKDLHKAYYA